MIYNSSSITIAIYMESSLHEILTKYLINIVDEKRISTVIALNKFNEIHFFTLNIKLNI